MSRTHTFNLHYLLFFVASLLTNVTAWAELTVAPSVIPPILTPAQSPLLTLPESLVANIPAASAASAGGAPSANFGLILRANVAVGAAQAARGIWGWTNTATDREYALVAAGNSLKIYEVTIPTATVLRAIVPAVGGDLKEVKSFEAYAYTASQSGPVQVIYLGDLPDTAYTVSTFIAPGVGGSHTLWIDSARSLLYLGMNGQGGQMPIIDIANPTAPTLASITNLHSQYCPIGFSESHDVWASGDTCWYAYLSSGIVRLNTANIYAPEIISVHRYTGAFTHNVWPSVDGKYLYSTDETPGGFMRIFDVRDLHGVMQVGAYQASPTAIIHNVFVRDTLIFIAYYTEGVKVVNVVNPTRPVEVASYDTYPQGSSNTFDGCWGAYPYFPSGTVVASDRSNGLFVFSFAGASPSAVAGKVTGADGRPAPGARIGAIGTTLETVADNEGDFTLSIGAGLKTISVIHSGHNPYFTSVDLAPGAVAPLNPVMTTLPGGVVAGTAPFPLGGHDTVRVAIRGAVSAPVIASADGSFNLGNLSSGTQIVAAYAWGLGIHDTTIDVASDSLTLTLGLSLGYRDNFEWDQEWTTGDNSCSAGSWLRSAPFATQTGTRTAQPDGDHGIGPDRFCWFTGASDPGASPTSGDVDLGASTLYSPTLDLTSFEDPFVTYWRWFFNSSTIDPFATGGGQWRVEISADDGASWTLIEQTVVGSSFWLPRNYRIRDFVVPSDMVRFRFVVSDPCGQDAIVEAAVDDFEITGSVVSCCTVGGDADASGGLSIGDAVFLVDRIFGAAPPPAVCSGELDADASGAVDIGDITYLIFYIFNRGPVPQCPQ